MQQTSKSERARTDGAQMHIMNAVAGVAFGSAIGSGAAEDPVARAELTSSIVKPRFFTSSSTSSSNLFAE
jgi:hypothetical protein